MLGWPGISRAARAFASRQETRMNRASTLAFTMLLGACASSSNYIYGTKVNDTEENRKIIDVCEQYRLAVEKKDAATLLAMASPNYWEDGGTPTGTDDYGYDGLRSVLETRFSRADGIRYRMRYMDVRRSGNRASVDVMIDATYSVASARGPQRLDMRDQNEMVLEWDGSRWLFLSGM
jgi:hypothetical protein